MFFKIYTWIILMLASTFAIAQQTIEWEHYLNTQFLPIGNSQAISSVKKIENPEMRLKAQTAQNINFYQGNDVAIESISTSEKKTSKLEKTSESEAPAASSIDEVAPSLFNSSVLNLPDIISDNEKNGLSSENTSLYARYKKEFNVHSLAYLYAQNLVSPLPQKAILVTQGQLDTYPVLVNQSVSNIRKDVVVINLNWLTSTKYRKSIEQKIGTKSGWKDGDNLEVLLKKLIAGYAGQTYISMTVNKSLLLKVQEYLKPFGLAFSVSNGSSNNHHTALEKFNWSQVSSPESPDYIKALNANYVAALLIDEKMGSSNNIGPHNRTNLLSDLYKQTGLKKNADKYLNK